MARKRITPGSMDQPSALYGVYDQKVAAGLDTLLYSPRPELEILAEYLSLNRVILGNGGFCLLLARIRFLPEHSLETPMDAGSAFADLLEAKLAQKAIYYMLPISPPFLALSSIAKSLVPRREWDPPPQIIPLGGSLRLALAVRTASPYLRRYGAGQPRRQ